MTKPPNIAPKLFPLPPTITIIQIIKVKRSGRYPEEAVGLIVNGFCKEVLQQLPMEFAVEAQKLVGISLEGSVG